MQLRAWTEAQWSHINMSKEAAAYYLAGMIDGEGCVYIGGQSGLKKCVQIANTDWDLIESTIRACQVLGIRYTVTEAKRQPPWVDAYTVMISGRFDLERVLELVPIQSNRKYQKLVQAVTSYAANRMSRSGFIRTPQHVTDERVDRMRRKHAMKQLEAHLREQDGRAAADRLEGIL